MDKNICLIGYMGSGKTTVGRMLAERLDMDFEDTDELIVKNEGRSIPDIFRDEGEAYFRRLETDLMKKLASDGELTDTVLSTGGGLPVDKNNRPLLKEVGTVVYLKAKPECLNTRVGNDSNRPLLASEDRLLKIRDMLAFRGPIYEECADIIIDTDELDAGETVDKIIMSVNKSKSS